MSFFEFPNTRTYDRDLGWLISAVKALKEAMETFIATNTLTFADPLEHSILREYGRWNIVLDPVGNAYVSLQEVPKGIELSNDEYWLMIFDYEAFLEKVNKNFTGRYYRNENRAKTAMVVGDWLTFDDVLCKVTADIAVDELIVLDTNIEAFTLEDFIKAFMASATQLINDYKADIDASEVAYRNQLAQDIANTTASLQAQLDLAISGATVDSEVINARLGADGVSYATLGDAIRTQIDNINSLNGLCTPIPAGDWLDGYRLNTSGSTYPAPTTNIYHRCITLPCKAGDKFILNVNANSYVSFKAWVFADANDDIIETAPVLGQLTDYIITAPTGAVKVGFNDYDAGSTWTGICYINDSVLDEIKTVDKNIRDNTPVFMGSITASDYSSLMANITDCGIYYIPSTEVFTDAPALVWGSTVASCLTVSLYASTLVKQEYINAVGESFTRLVTISTNTPITSGGIPCDSNGWYRTFDLKYGMYKGNLLAADYSNLISNVITYGAYYISSAQVFNDRPDDAIGTIGAVLITIPFASTITLQFYYDAFGKVRQRMILNSTKQPYTTGIAVDSNGWFSTSYRRWENKRIVCFGDSRTWYDGKAYTSNCKPELIGLTCVGYQEQIRKLTGAILVNEGVSGQTSIQICTRIRAYDFTGVDAVFLEGGVNDFIANPAPSAGSIAPIGSTFDTSTIYGAWQSAIEYIMNNYPDVKIFIDIPAIGWKQTNTVYPYTTAEIKKEVAALYNLPVLDLYTTAGITVLNRDTFYADNVGDTGWYLHFNDFGNKVIGQMIAKYLENN